MGLVQSLQWIERYLSLLNGRAGQPASLVLEGDSVPALSCVRLANSQWSVGAGIGV
jgi:hypothetical protein